MSTNNNNSSACALSPRQLEELHLYKVIDSLCKQFYQPNYLSESDLNDVRNAISKASVSDYSKVMIYVCILMLNEQCYAFCSSTVDSSCKMHDTSLSVPSLKELDINENECFRTLRSVVREKVYVTKAHLEEEVTFKHVNWKLRSCNIEYLIRQEVKFIKFKVICKHLINMFGVKCIRIPKKLKMRLNPASQTVDAKAVLVKKKYSTALAAFSAKKAIEYDITSVIEEFRAQYIFNESASYTTRLIEKSISNAQMRMCTSNSSLKMFNFEVEELSVNALEKIVYGIYDAKQKLILCNF